MHGETTAAILRAKMATVRHGKHHTRSVISSRAPELWLARRRSFQLPPEQIGRTNAPVGRTRAGVTAHGSVTTEMRIIPWPLTIPTPHHFLRPSASAQGLVRHAHGGNVSVSNTVQNENVLLESAHPPTEFLRNGGDTSTSKTHHDTPRALGQPPLKL